MGPGRKEKNFYRQALDAKFAVSDEMHAAVGRRSVGLAEPDRKYYKSLQAFLCFDPEIPAGSRLPSSDYRVEIASTATLFARLGKAGLHPGWSREQWLSFASRLKLRRLDPAALTTKRPPSPEARYTDRLRAFLGGGVPLVPTRIAVGDHETTSDQLLKVVGNAQHTEVIGPSGSGKSYALLHAALEATGTDYVPVIARARFFQGDLNPLLAKATNPFFEGSLEELLTSITASGKRLLLIIDGVNEVTPVRDVEVLLGQLQALAIRTACVTVLSSQGGVKVPPELKGQRLAFLPLNESEKEAVYRSHGGPPELFQGDIAVRAYEASVLAAVAREIPPGSSRFRLFEAYCRRVLKEKDVETLGVAALVATARALNESLASTIPEGDFLRITEQKAEVFRADAEAVERLLHSALLQVESGRLAFAHDLLQEYFEAEALLRNSAGDISAVARDLASPRNHRLGSWILGSLSSPADFTTVVDGQPFERRLGLLRACADGTCGPAARFFWRREAIAALDSVVCSLVAGDFVFQFSEGGPQIEARSPRATAIGHSIAVMMRTDPELVDRVIVVLKALDRAWASAVAGLPREGRAALREHGYRYTYVYGPSLVPNLLSNVDAGFSDLSRDVLELILRHAEDDATGPGMARLTLAAFRHAARLDVKLLGRFTQRCWDLRILSIRAETMHSLQFPASKLDEAKRKKLVPQLESYLGKDPFQNSFVMDVLSAWGELESPVPVESAISEIRGILDKEGRATEEELSIGFDPDVAALGVIGNGFEDTFQGAYSEAIEALPQQERQRLFVMAAHGGHKENSAFALPYVLRELAKTPTPAAADALRSFTRPPNSAAVFINNAIDGFVLAWAGLSRFDVTPRKPNRPLRSADLAWHTIGELLFWCSKPGMTRVERSVRCSPLWEEARSVCFDVVDPLFWVETGRTGAWDGGEPVARSITRECPDDVAALLLLVAPHLEKMKLWHRSGARDVKAWVIGMLGALAASDAVPILEALAASAECGSAAVDAIRHINDRLGHR